MSKLREAGLVLSWSSLLICASIIIFLNRRDLRSELLQCLSKGKGASPSASKALVRPKYHPTYFTQRKSVCFLRCVPSAKTESCHVCSCFSLSDQEEMSAFVCYILVNVSKIPERFALLSFLLVR